MDEYDARIEELKDQKLEIGGQLAPLAHDDPRRAWWHQRAGELDDELRVLIARADELRRLDAGIDRLNGRINAAGARLDDRAESWRLASWWLGTPAALFFLLTVWTVWLPWSPLLTFAMVSGCVYARSRYSRIPHEADGFILGQDERRAALESQREMILRSTGQSPSASNPAAAQERSSGYSVTVPEFPGASQS